MARQDRDNSRTSDESGLKEKLVSLNRVAKVTKGGRTFSFAAVVVVGDGKRQVGQGLGKAREVSEAIAKAVKDAEKNLIKVPVLNGTIPHEAHGKYDAGRVLIKPAAHGTGVIAGGPVRALCDACGIKDILVKSLGSGNPINVLKAAIDGFQNLVERRHDEE